MSHFPKDALAQYMRTVCKNLSEWLTTSAHAGNGQSSLPDAPTVACDRCGGRMQLASEKRDANGKLIYQQFVCGCPPVGVYYKTYHAGDQTHHA